MSERRPRDLDIDPLDDEEDIEELDEIEDLEDDFVVDPEDAVQFGKPWSPPENPPTIISDDDIDDVEIGVGFGLEGTEVELDEDEDYPEARDLPEEVEAGDYEIAQRVRKALRRDATTAALDVDVEVEDGIVTLFGEVETIDDSDNAEEVALEVPGVIDVVNELVVAGM